MKKHIEKIDNSPIIFYYYFDLTDTNVFCDLIKERFLKSGHNREIEFREWDCYNVPPKRDGDIYCYDALALTTLVDEGYIRPLPDIIDTSNIFEWVLERSTIKRKIYGVPLMSCASVLISRSDEPTKIKNIYDLPPGLAAPMKSMILNFYLYAFCSFQNRKDEIMKAMKQLKKVIGEEGYKKSRFAVYDGIERFKKGECRYILGFTEDLRNLEPGSYNVELLNCSDSDVNEMPFFMMDYASVGKNVSVDKLLDCIDILEIMADSDFVYDVCTANGKLQYMLPANKTIYPRLAELDSIYNKFYEMINNEDNCLLRFGKHYYGEHEKMEEEILRMLEEDV